MKYPRSVYDAWKVKPPCETEGVCYVECPLYPDCYAEEEEEIDEGDDMDLWDKEVRQ